MTDLIEKKAEQSEQPRLDRTKFKAQTLQEADHQLDFWLSKSQVERLLAAAYLNSVAWGYDLNNPPKMDKSRFSTRKYSH